VIACPEGLLIVDDPEYVLPAFSFPPFYICLGDVADHVGEAAGAASFALDVFRMLHFQGIAQLEYVCKKEMIEKF
jgi:hypothetical protein